jgi:putative ABC transport system permease protein
LVAAFAISLPLAFYGTRLWLEGFAFKMNINYLVFFIALGVVGIITLITVFMQSFRTATANPVEAIRYE